MTVKPCPADCTFDWQKFHDDLDMAMAHIIDDAPMGSLPDDYFPSRISGIDIAKYAQEKIKLKENDHAE